VTDRPVEHDPGEEQADLPPEAPEVIEDLPSDLPEGEPFDMGAARPAQEPPVGAPSPEGDASSADGGSGSGAATGAEDEAQDDSDEPDELGAMKQSLADRTNDLQRLQAEYANYRKRVDRDRQLVAENAAYKALTPVIDVLDTIDRAKEHGELDGGFKAVAEQLERAVAASGFVRFGEPGDAFDPTLHEALSHLGADAEVSVTTVKHVAKAGFRLGDRVLRAAQVLVVDPPDGA
jgi:molecular chaperone GrpE